MAHIKSEGKINDNTYLIDAMMLRLPCTLALYVIENDGERLMMDTGEPLSARKIIKKLKEFNQFPIHKLLITHSHWDHCQGWDKLKKLNGDFEIMASENAIENLRDPKSINDVYGFEVPPLEGEITPLKEGDIIDLNGLELKILNFFGHTTDSIAILDEKNKNIFTADAIIDKYDEETYLPIFMPPVFNEAEVLKTFKKLRSLRNQLKSISLTHFGVWTGDDVNKIINQMEDHYLKTKEAVIQWYNEDPSIEYLSRKYHEKFIPNSKIHTKENILGLNLVMEWAIEGLKISGFIK